MPDGDDYDALAELLAGARSWDPEKLRMAERLLESQRALVDEAHPKDYRGRRRRQEVVDQIEAAILDYRSLYNERRRAVDRRRLGKEDPP